MNKEIEYVKEGINLRFKHLKFDGLPLLPNDRLVGHKLMSLSVALNIMDGMLDHLVDAIWKDVYTSTLNQIFKEVTQTTNQDYINLITLMDGSGYPNNKVGMRIFDYLYGGQNFNPSDNLLSNVRITSEYIIDCPQYISDEIDTTRPISISTIYPTGKLGQTKIYVDPYMKWTDYQMYLFDSIEYDITDTVLFEVVNESSFTPRLVIKFKVAAKANNPLRIDLIEKKDSDAYRYWLAEIRDDKIDKLIN